MNSSKKLLPEVVIIRLVLIIFLVLYHSFAIYNGTWDIPLGLYPVNAYWWVASFSYSFMLETFVFISGYVFGYQVRTKFNNQVVFQNCVVKKAIRLLIPSIVFRIIYFICFHINKGNSLGSILYNIIIGYGHLWFLPMLFLCFIITFIVEKLQINHKYIILLALFASVFSLGPLSDLPFRISSVLSYYIFFAIGYYIQKNGVSICNISIPKRIFVFFVAYIIVFVAYHLILKNQITITDQISTVAIITDSILRRVLKLSQAILGLLSMFSLVNYLLNKGVLQISSFSIKLSGYCFGVYIFQQFILLYFITNPYIIAMLGSYSLPWIAFTFTLLVSLILTGLLLKTKVGRFLVG